MFRLINKKFIFASLIITLVLIFMINIFISEVFKTTDYKNNWPTESLGNQKVFYYKIIRENKLIKAGTISVLH